MSIVGKWYGFGHSASYDAGIRAREKGETSAAVEFFRLALAEPLDPSLKKVIARTLANALGRLAREHLASDPAAALGLLLEGLALEPEFADLWLWKARALRLLGTEGEAADVERALSINPRYSEALLHKAALSAESGRWEDARSLFDQAMEAMPRLAGPESAEAASLVDGRSLQAAKALLAIHPRDPRALSLVDEGDLLGMRRKWAAAEAAFSAALDLAPGYADIRCRRAQALMELGRLEEADRELLAALDLNPRYAEALAIRGVLKRRTGEDEEAMTLFAQALEVDPSQPIAREEMRRGPQRRS